jgi:hypothetical protein
MEDDEMRVFDVLPGTDDDAGTLCVVSRATSVFASTVSSHDGGEVDVDRNCERVTAFTNICSFSAGISGEINDV